LPLPSGTFRTRTHALLVVSLASVLVVSGCLAAGGPDPLPSGETAAERFASVEGYNATYHTSTDGLGTATNTTMRVATRPASDVSRIEILSPPSRAGNVVVNNGTTVWRYNASAERATRLSGPSINRTGRPGRSVERLVTRANAESAANASTSAGVSALPVVPGTPTPVSAVAGASSRVNTTYLGRDTVAGRSAYVVRTRPVDRATSTMLNRTVWLDTERFLTLRTRSVVRVDGDRVVFDRRVENLRIDPDVPDGTFEFTPPADATVEEAGSSFDTDQYGSVDELAAAADVSVPRPEVPGEFEFEYARRSTYDDVRSVSLTYRTDTQQLSVTKQNRTAGNGSADGQPVRVGDRPGTYSTFGATGTVRWTCDGHRYHVGGTVPKETLLRVAESVGCQ
jgi:outer membrane lipoprotein-sorting protein